MVIDRFQENKVMNYQKELNWTILSEKSSNTKKATTKTMKPILATLLPQYFNIRNFIDELTHYYKK